MAQQTAVEYIIEQLSESGHLTSEAGYYCRNLIRQAKQMESSQMDSEYRKGWEAAEEVLSKEIDSLHEYYRSHRTT